MTNLSNTLLRQGLTAFAKYRNEYLTGDEKGEAQVFCDRLFKAFGHEGLREAGATLEFRIAKDSNKGTSFADLMWKPRCLIEMKKAGADLSKHYRQAFDYWIRAVPDRPRYVVLCNFDEFWVYDFDQQLDAPMDRLKIDLLAERWDALSFLLPDPAEPIFQHNLVGVTREAAADVAHVFTALVDAGSARTDAQRFALQCVMAMFAEDIGLLPGAYFTRAVDDCLESNLDPYDTVLGLFREMNTVGTTAGGRFQGTPYFNGGLFATVPNVVLSRPELIALRDAAKTNWSFVRPEIFGTLFEQSMDQSERHATGAHFTSQADIMRVVGPCIVDAWRERIEAAKTIGDLEKLLGEMFNFRVLDPACGSGNFLYVAYREMRRLEADILDRIDERRQSKDRAQQRSLSYVTPDHFYGIDVNSFAVEVAKVTMMLAKKLSADELDDTQNVLPLDSLDDTIVATDALFTEWPKANVIIGNPPYLGRRKMVAELGADYCARLAERHPNVSGVSDFVTYWVPIAHRHLPEGGRAGLVTTNSIKQNESRNVSLDYIVANGGAFFEAVSAIPWSGDAAVTVSIFNWIKGEPPATKVLWLNDGQLRLETANISGSLSPETDVSNARPIRSNQRPASCFQGQTPGVVEGFVLNAEQRAAILSKKDGSAFFVCPFLGGDQLLGKIDIDRWVIDLPHDSALDADFAAPAAFAHVRDRALPVREEAAKKELERNAEVLARNSRAKPNRHHQAFLAQWWQQGYRRAEMLDAITKSDRYIGTSRYASEKRLTVFTFLDATVRPSDQVTAFALDDDYSFGVLSSQVHRLWLEARCSTLETRLRYTSTTVWDSFPWPQRPSEANVDRIVSAAAAILTWRQTQLSRGISLKRMYDSLRTPGRNELRTLHEELDAAVLEAYDFNPDEDVLTQLLALNHSVSALPDNEQRGPGGYGLAGVRVTNYRVTGPAD